jgi:hypothetical protein
MGRLTLNEITEWIMTNFPFYRNGPKAWRVREVLFKFYVQRGGRAP